MLKSIVSQKKNAFFYSKHLQDKKKSLPLHPQSRNKHSKQIKDGPFVYRLGRKIFILERGVRFPHGLQTYNLSS